LTEGGRQPKQDQFVLYQLNQSALTVEVKVRVEGVLEWNQIPRPMGQAQKIHNALARISTTHLYAPIRTSAHLYAPYALCAGHLGAFLNPGLASFFFSLKIQHESEISISTVSRNTGSVARRGIARRHDISISPMAALHLRVPQH
jgi:hypothetical protein